MNELDENNGSHIFRDQWERINTQERKVIAAVLHRISLPRNPNKELSDDRTFGERAADLIAAFGGSWTFIIIFGSGLILWTFLNTEILGPRMTAFDPYPFIFLNLILSMLAAIQAPIIMMSQKRQGKRDRLEADVDHEVNVRAELAIRQLDERLQVINDRLVHLTNFVEDTPRAPS